MARPTLLASHGIAAGSGMKAAALLFDRIYADPLTATICGVPGEIRFDPPGVASAVGDALIWGTLDVGPDSRVDEQRAPYTMPNVLRAVRWACKQRGVEATLFYPSQLEFDSNHPPSGESAAAVAVLAGIEVVSPDLSWDHVLQFRRDAVAIGRYRALRGWLQGLLRSKSISEAEDAVSQCIADYLWAVKKHGLLTVTGTLADIIDTRALATLATASGLAAFAAGPLSAALVGGSLTLAKVAVKLVERKIALEELRQEHCAVATIHEIRSIVNGGA